MRGNAWLVLLAVGACTRGEHGQPGVAPASSAAALLAKSFAADVVGTIRPTTPVAGTYAMALDLAYEGFASAELEVKEFRKGGFRVTLAPDGTANGCIGSGVDEVTNGQYHFEPDPAKRKHSSRHYARQLALAGTWKLVDNVAEITLDRTAFDTCDATQATAADTPPRNLRCIGVGNGARVPAGSLLCAGDDRADYLGMGLPFTETTRTWGTGGAAPSGRSFVLGTPGVLVDVSQRREAPTLTFRAGDVAL